MLPLELFFGLASLLLAGVALRGSTRAWRFDQQPVDLAMRGISGVWFIYVTASLASAVVDIKISFLQMVPLYVQVLSFEVLQASLAVFLLSAAGAIRPWLLAAVALHLMVGLLGAGYYQQDVQASGAVSLACLAVKLVVAALVTVSIARMTRYTQSLRSWLALAACAMGLGVWLYHAAALDTTQAVLPVGLYPYAFFLFVVWKLVSLNPDADKKLAHVETSFAATSTMQPMSSLSADDDLVLLAVRGERQRIAYELHDNVCSQIVSILSALQGADQPQKRFVMLSLEQCLSDLKMTVDAMESFEEAVTLSLGRLRYRIQPGLDRQAITMCWDVEVSEQLSAIHGIYAQQVLRIAQESLANVMRHAKASSVRVACRYVPEFNHLSLQVSDNGVGMAAHHEHRCMGRGLTSMKRRAAAVGGFLTISSPRAGGTHVSLVLPLPHLSSAQKPAPLPEALWNVGPPPASPSIHATFDKDDEGLHNVSRVA